MKIPKVVEFVKELPRHIDGKLVKRELEDKYWQGIEKRG
jgi:acyl-coenzyme A synthetase/AMP-(fatty) acid ligase